jgi:hypothetical protein
MDSVEEARVYFRVTLLSLIVIPLSINLSEDRQRLYEGAHIYGDLTVLQLHKTI